MAKYKREKKTCDENMKEFLVYPAIFREKISCQLTLKLQQLLNNVLLFAP